MKKGFALLELLVAVSLLALIGSAVYVFVIAPPKIPPAPVVSNEFLRVQPPQEMPSEIQVQERTEPAETVPPALPLPTPIPPPSAAVKPPAPPLTPPSFPPPQADKIEAGGTVLILVDEALSSGLKEELTNYTQDIKRELGLSVFIKNVSSAETVHSLKSYVLNFFRRENLNGVLLVGNVPTAYFYHPDIQSGSVFTSEGLILGDYIYQDILSACEFSTERNAFSYKNEECQVGITIQPYWVARLTPNSSVHSDIELLKSYFRRNHEYRNGSYTFEQKALLYQPVILDYKGTEQETINKIKKDLNSFGGVYSPSNYRFVDIFSPSSDSDYLSELSKGYETLIFNGHGAPLFHQKNITPQSQIKAKFFFGNFLSCSVGRFTTKDYLAGEYLFSEGLVTLAASTPVFASPDFDAELHNMLANGVPFYKAIEWSGIGDNILGDPTLRMRYGQQIPSQSQIRVSVNQLTFSKEKPTPEFTVENISNASFYFYVRGKYLKQKYHSYLKGFSSVVDANSKVIDGIFLLEPHKKTVVNMPSEYFFPYGKIPSGTYKGKYFIVSTDDRNPLITLDLDFIEK